MTTPVKARARRRDSIAAEAAFRARVAELGGRVVEPEWLGGGTYHRVVCTAGHDSRARPDHVKSGVGICRKCVGLDPQLAEQKFRARVAALGGRVIEPVWLGSSKPHRVLCPKGHIGRPYPGNVGKGEGICRICVSNDPETANKEFRQRMAEWGAQVLEPRWLGATTPHRSVCAAGHVCQPRPGALQQGEGPCRICGGRDSATAGKAFYARVSALGGQVEEPTWLGSFVRHQITCSEGHRVTCLPADLATGRGLCRFCAGKAWDGFYVLQNPKLHRVKFGITSGDFRPRLQDHRLNGYTEVLRTKAELPTSPDLERSVIAALDLAGFKPVQGREYYDVSALPLILDVADHWEVAV